MSNQTRIANLAHIVKWAKSGTVMVSVEDIAGLLDVVRELEGERDELRTLAAKHSESADRAWRDREKLIEALDLLLRSVDAGPGKVCAPRMADLARVWALMEALEVKQ